MMVTDREQEDWWVIASLGKPFKPQDNPAKNKDV